MKLIEVDYDPFAPTKGAKPAKAPRLVEVDYDPFAQTPPIPLPPERPAQFGPSAPVYADVPLPTPRPADLTSATTGGGFGGESAGVPANVPMPMPRPRELTREPVVLPPVQPLADDMPAIAETPEIDPSSGQWTGRMIPGVAPADPQGVRPAPGGKNNILNSIYQKLGIDPRSNIDTGAAYDEFSQKADAAGKAYEEASAAVEPTRAREDEQMRRLEAAAAKGNTFAADRLAVLKQQRAAGAITDTQAAEYETEQAREAKVKAGLTGPAITSTGRNMAEAVPRVITNQAVDTGSAASRIFHKVLEPLDSITGIDTKAKDKNREAYWERRRRAVAGAFASDPALADNFGQQLVEGFASTAGFAAAGLAGRAAGIGAKLTTAVAGALPQGEQSWRTLDDFYKKNPELDADWKRWTNFAIGLGSGATESLPIGHLFSRLERVSGGGVTRLLGITAAQGGEEATQEALQKLIENAQKQWFIDPRAPITEEVGKSMLIGALVGAGMAGTAGAAKLLLEAGRGADQRVPMPENVPSTEVPPELQPGSPVAESPPATGNEPPAEGPPTLAGGQPPAVVPSPPEAPTSAYGTKLSEDPSRRGWPKGTGGFADPVEEAAPPPAPTSRATPEQDALLRGAGYTPEQIAEMGEIELAAAVEEEQAAGTKPALPVLKTAPEPAKDIAAQVATLNDPTSTKDAVFVAAGNEAAVPAQLPENAEVVTRPEGTLITTNPDKAAAFEGAENLTDEDVGALLGYPGTKMDAVASGAGTVIEGRDKDGNVVSQAVTSPEKAAETAAAVDAQTPEGGSVAETTPQAVLHDRAERAPPSTPVSASETGTLEAVSAPPPGMSVDMKGAGMGLLRPDGIPARDGTNTPGIHFRVAEDGIHVEGSYLPQGSRGKGLGKSMYQHLLDAAGKAGVPLHSDSQASPDVQRLYEGLRARGYQVDIHPTAHTDDNGKTLYADGPVYTVQPLAAPAPGTRAAPVKVEKPEDLAAVAPVVNTEPTDGQKAAGNYQHAHVNFDGFDIAIENPKGSTRTGKDTDGNEWSTTMPGHYGRIKRSRGADGDQIDVYIGDKPANGRVFVIDQFDPKTGKFDEHKAVMGVDSQAEAEALYDAAFSDGGASRRGGVREMPSDYFRSWIDKPGHRRAPVSVEGKRRAAGLEAPAAPSRPQRTVVGKNSDGETIEQDENGVRSIASGGIRRTESVAIGPDGTRAVDPARRPSEFKTVDEQAPATPEAVSGGVSSENAPNRPKDPVAAAFFDHLVKGGSFPNILQARKMAKEAGGTDDAKVVEEKMELAVVSAAKTLIEGKDELEAFDKLVDLYKRQPNLNTRTSTSMRDQAYSTPIPLAYVAQRLAGITKTSHVLEPTAGNGALVFTADPNLVIANEFNKGRADHLEEQGYTVTEFDATSQKASTEWFKMGLIGPNGYFNAVITNPPFGVVKDDKGESKVFDLSDTRAGYTTTQIDHAIVMRSIARMEPKKGRAVLIIGGPAKTDNRAEAYNGQQKRAFFKTLYDLYNVTDHFTVSGDLYSRQGASWPVDVIVIEGRGKSARRLPAVDVPPVLDSWEAVKEKLNGQVGAGDQGADADLLRPDAAGDAGADAGSAGTPEQGGPAGVDAQPAQPDVVREPASQPGSEPATGVAGVAEPAAGAAEGGGKPGRPGAKAPAERRPPRVEDPNAAFDAAFDDLFGDKPAAAPAAGGRAPRAPTIRGLAADAAVESAKGLDDALTGLYQLFGAGKTIGSGPVFDEETYAKAKPFFIAAVQHLKNAASDLVEIAKLIMRKLVDKFGPEARAAVENMRPYIVRFMGDVKDGKVDMTARPAPAPKPEEAAPAGPRKSAPQEKETDKQVAYKPTSEHGGLGTLVPINMQTAIQTALDKIAAEHGSVDKFVAEELGYTLGSKAFLDAFAAEQVDAIALAISNFKKDAGFIIGDQTGIGKGRVNAAVIRWAIKNGLTPIFVTEKPNLYGDMYRDMNDIGVPEFLGREPKMLMTNPGEKVPLDADALEYLAERDRADELGQPRPPRYGKFLSAFSGEKQKRTLNEFAAAGKPGDYDVVFTTYNQMQTVKGRETERTLFLKAIAPNAVLIFDESHNAGGQEGKPRPPKKGDPVPIPRSQTARDLVSLARSVFYSSATFAKRPSVMDLYSKTDMRLAVDDDVTKLAGAIKDGGVPMQQVVSTMLAEAGQYIRRERSFDGVVYDTPVVEVDREKYNDFSNALQQILQFSNAMRDVVGAMEAELAAEGEVTLEDGSTGEAGVESMNFTSVMHNLIAQYLLAAKADIASDRAIAALEAGEKPVLTVASTLESFLSQYAEDNNLKPGADINIDFSQLLVRYLDRVRTVTIKDAYGDKTKKYLSDEELGPAGLNEYDNALQFIRDLDFGDLPVSPIDHIHRRLSQAGYKSAEITGRGMIIAYQSRSGGVLRNRPPADIKAAGRKVNIEKFNNQEPGQKSGISAIILNQAGSTGLSLHANKTFKNQNKRVMIVVQAEANIDTHMQMLGRVHRTGQVVLPRYEQLIASIPAEKRPAAVLQKKMASLNASTTASREGALTAKDVPDIMNQYGDLIAKQWLADNSDVIGLLGGIDLPEKKEADPTEDGAMRKLTGRIPLLPIDEQERVYDELESRYADYIEQLEAMGGNALEAKALDLDAKVVESSTMVEGKGGESPFAAPVVLSIYDVRRLGKPMSAKSVVDRLAKDATALDEAGAAEYEKLADAEGVDRIAMAVDAIARRASRPHQASLAKAIEEGRAYSKMVLDGLRDAVKAIDAPTKDQLFVFEQRTTDTRQRLNDNMTRFAELAGMMRPGAKIRILTPSGDSVTGVVLKLEKQGKAKNPLALGTWRVTFVAPLNNPVVGLNLSQLQTDEADASKFKVESAEWEPLNTTLQLMDDLAKGGAREKRIIATGNILSGFAALRGRGQIISFTDDEGRKQPGILMPSKLKKLDEILNTINRPLLTGADALQFMQTSGDDHLFDIKREIQLTLDRYSGGLTVRIVGAKSKGGKYFMSRAVTDAAGGDFYKPDNSPWAKKAVSDVRSVATIDALIAAGARFEAPPVPKKKVASSSQSAIREAPAGWDVAEPGPAPERGPEIVAAIREIVDRMVGAENVGLELPSILISDDAEASLRSGGEARTGHEIAGLATFFTEGQPLIRVSLSPANADPISTAYHEAFHIVQGYGIVHPQEREVLKREVPRLRAMLHRQTRSTMGDWALKISDKEVEAYAFEFYAAARDEAGGAMGIHVAVRRAFDRVLEFIRRLGNALRGMGFQTTEDIYGRAYDGTMRDRIRSDEFGDLNYDYPGVSYSTFSPKAVSDLEAYNANAGLNPLPPAAARAKAFQESDRGRIETGLRKLQDDFIDLRRYQQDITSQVGDIPEGQDAYNAAALFPGRLSARLTDFDSDHVDPLVKAMIDAGVTQDELGMALLARHARERNAFIKQRDAANDAGSGLADAAADQIIADMQASGRWAILQPLMAQVDAMIAADRRARLAAGLISQDTYNEWATRFRHYVPLQGVNGEQDEEGAPNTGRGFDVRGRESKIAYGRYSIPNNPVHNALLQAQEGLVRSEKNRVDRALLKLVQANPNPDLWVVNERRFRRELDPAGKVRMVQDHSLRYEPNVLGVKVGGKVTYITLKDVGLAEAFRALPNDAARNAAVRAIGKVTRAYGQLQTTVNPDFLVRNPLRDLQEAGFTLFIEKPALAATFGAKFPSAAATIARIVAGRPTPEDQRVYDEWRRNGGQIHYNAFKLIDDIKEDMKAKLGESDPVTLRNAPRIAAEGVAMVALKPLRVIAAMNEFVENATRLAVFQTARAHGYSPGRSARLAREATVNFTRRGQWTTGISAFKVFFNPAMQGGVKLAQQLVGPANPTPQQQSMTRRARTLYFGLMPFASLLTLWNMYAAGDDEDDKLPGGPKSLYNKIPAYERERSVIFVYGSHVVNGKRLPRYVKLPAAFGLGIPIVMGEQMTLLAMGQTTPGAAAGQTMKAILAAFNPLGQSDNWINLAMPSLLGLPIDLTMNRDWAGRPIVPTEQRYNQGIPRSEQYFSSTSQTAVDMARGLREKTGIDLYPGWITYTAGWAAGGVGRFVKHSADTASNMAAGIPTPIERMPFVRNFLGNVDLAAEQNTYFQNRQKVIAQNNRVVNAKRTLDRAPADTLARRDLDQGAADLGLGLKKGRFERKGSLPNLYDNTDKALSDYRKRIGDLRRDRTMPASQREVEIRKVRELMDTLMRQTRRESAVFPGAAR